MTESLARLRSDDLLDLTVGVASVGAVVQILRSCSLVKDVTLEFAENTIDLGDVRSFVSEVLSAFRPGVAFSGDVTLAALAVALARIPGAESILQQLSAVSVRELTLSPRVARLILEERAQSLVATTTASLELSVSVPQIGQKAVARQPPPIAIETTESLHQVAA
jgi:hypothetical protein